MESGALGFIAEEGVFASSSAMTRTQRSYTLLMAMLDSVINGAVLSEWLQTREFFVDYITEEDWGEAFLAFPLYLSVYKPADGSNKFANLGWPGWLWVMTALNEKGVYMDLHDGTSMGGNIVFVDRGSFLNSMFDLMAECDHAEAVSVRMNSLRNDLSWIWTVADATPNGFSYECPNFDNRRRNPNGDTLAVVNTYMLDDWGIHRRETLSNSIRRYDNLTARLAEAHGRIDANKAMDIFDLTLFNEDGTFRENGGRHEADQARRRPDRSSNRHQAERSSDLDEDPAQDRVASRQRRSAVHGLAATMLRTRPGSCAPSSQT